MSVPAAFHLALHYVLRHRLQSLLLCLALGASLALPVAVRTFAKTVEAETGKRASGTPLVLGAKGSSLDLLLSALYFRRQPIAPITLRQVDLIRASGLGDAIPLLVRFHSQGSPIVGVDLAYFDFRGLGTEQGHLFTRLGDCVVGARLAIERGLKPGDSVFSSPEQVFDIAGVYPLKMRVTGVLAPTGSPDDHAVFVDLKTAWLIEGRSHGHDDLASSKSAPDVLKRDSTNIVGSAAVRMFNEVTAENLSGFHFHGDPADYPITSAIVLPRDAKSEAILSGRHQDPKGLFQLIRPSDELSMILSTLFQIEGAIILGLVFVGFAAAAIAVIVFTLSFQMRVREFATLADIGVSLKTLNLIKAFEVVLIGIGGMAIASIVVGLVIQWGPSLVLRALQ
jgi:putative ABC transport system permease protein